MHWYNLLCEYPISTSFYIVEQFAFHLFSLALLCFHHKLIKVEMSYLLNTEPTQPAIPPPPFYLLFNRGLCSQLYHPYFMFWSSSPQSSLSKHISSPTTQITPLIPHFILFPSFPFLCVKARLKERFVSSAAAGTLNTLPL